MSQLRDAGNAAEVSEYCKWGRHTASVSRLGAWCPLENEICGELSGRSGFGQGVDEGQPSASVRDVDSVRRFWVFSCHRTHISDRITRLHQRGTTLVSMSDISPQAFIGEGVTLGNDVKIGPGAVLLGPCVVEDGVWIGPGAQIGAPPEMSNMPQNAAWAGDLKHTGVRLCEGAVIREGAVIHQGSYRETTVGPRSWVLNRAYLAHDVLLGADATVSAGVSIGGHCVIGDRVNIGMNAVVHQRRIIADGAMVGMGTPVTRDVPPFAKVYGTPPRIAGVNSVGVERAGHFPELADVLLAHYRAGALLASDEEVPGDLGTLQEAVERWLAHPDLRSATLA